MITDSKSRDLSGMFKGKCALVEDGRLRVTDVDFSGVELAGGSICDVIFDCCMFEGVDGTGLKIENTDFDGGDFSDANFSGATFRNVSFYAVTGLDAKFDYAELQNTEFLGCNLECASFKHAVFEDLRFAADNTGYRTGLAGADFSDAIVSHLVFAGAEYTETTAFPKNIFASRISGLVFQKV